ncbi:MAG: nucleotidyltransferase domain-containing protein [Mariprofundaceae bacterium]|nr:nucleotidyltransferase domain-containing protein [Mariprofundaceae bacterium]
MNNLKLDLQPQYLQDLQHILHDIVPEHEVWAYGSRVFGLNHEASDLDLLLYQTQAPQQRATNIGDLQQALSESNLPILVQVSDWACVPDEFKAEIRRGFVKIQCPAQKGSQYELKNES